MRGFLLFVFIFLFINCNDTKKSNVSAVEDARSIAAELKNMKIAGDMEELEDWAIKQAPIFQSEWNLAHSEDEWLQIPSQLHYAVWLIDAKSMKKLYLELYYGFVPFCIDYMVAFCWHANEIIVMSRNDKEDLFHEVGHAQFPSGGEAVAEAFRIWCNKRYKH